jgi:hypothetical protein
MAIKGHGDCSTLYSRVGGERARAAGWTGCRPGNRLPFQTAPPLELHLMSDPNPTLATPPALPERLSLAELYPLCFDWKKPRPLKLRIHRDLAAGHNLKQVRRALGAYCCRPNYQKALRVGATRIDLDGQPAGVVTAAEVELARTSRVPPDAARAALPPNDTPLPKENLVPGRLELTVKFSELPKPLSVQDGVKIGIQTREGIVTAILPPKAWRTLEQAAKTYPQWVAALSGALERHEGEVIGLKQPTLQVFEKKAGPTVAAPTPAPGREYLRMRLKGRITPTTD